MCPECEKMRVLLADGSNRWVAVSNRKPKDGDVVLCYWGGPIPSMESLRYYACDSDVDGREVWIDVTDFEHDEPDYWMPLPEAPK